MKVLDFGLVKGLGSLVERGAADLTAENVVQGTPAFIAPEQALGDAAVGGRADVYATGCVAYWLLTGRHVFTADTPIGILMHHATSPPIPPSARTDRPIPADLERLVLRCLAKDPADRPQSARELSLALDGLVGESEAWTDEQARNWWSEHGGAPAPLSVSVTKITV